MFTRIKDGENIWQIKSGYDDLELYNLGDKVDQWINPNRPNSGKLLDDIYDGILEGSRSNVRAWIVIKEGIICAIESFDPEDEIDPNVSLKEKYQIKDYPRETWSEEVWKKKEDSELKFQQEYEEFEKSIAHLPAEQRLALIMCKPLMNKMNYSFIAQATFKNEKIK